MQLTRRARRQHIDVVVLAQVEIPQGMAHKGLGNLDLFDAAAVIQPQLLQQVRPHQLHPQALTHHF